MISPYGNGTSNVLSVIIHQDGSISSRDLGINFKGPYIPKGLIQMDSSLGWTMIANLPDYMALLSAAYRHGLTHRELLIFNKTSNAWNSILVEGPQTAPIIINGWMAGVVANIDPETDFETHKGFPPILGEEVVLIDPDQNRQFTVHLSNSSEVLWIENDDVFYRVDDELYRAKIDNDNFIDRQMLLKDERIRHFHWAFRAKSPEDVKEKNLK